MDKEPMLTIAIITMNREEQLQEAINSCLNCKLPSNTQFVIVDNASTDNTKVVVDNIKNTSQYTIDYFFSSTNVGGGGGRNIAFNLSKGKYVYFLDDDAIIDPNCMDIFFSKCITLMEYNQDVASLSTNIYDIICGNDRNLKGPFLDNQLTDILMWRGGSHFLRRSAFVEPLYLDIIYGCEELAPSIKAWDYHFRNVYYDGVRIIHKPLVNKWEKGSESVVKIAKLAIANHYATFSLLYPIIFHPMISFAMLARCKKNLNNTFEAYRECKRMGRETMQRNKVKKVSVRTVINLWRKFGWSVF